MSAPGEARNARRSGSTAATRSPGPRGTWPITPSRRSQRPRRGSLLTGKRGDARGELDCELDEIGAAAGARHRASGDNAYVKIPVTERPGPAARARSGQLAYPR